LTDAPFLICRAPRTIRSRTSRGRRKRYDVCAGFHRLLCFAAAVLFADYALACCCSMFALSAVGPRDGVVQFDTFDYLRMTPDLLNNGEPLLSRVACSFCVVCIAV
jgi:hypothetical protein